MHTRAAVVSIACVLALVGLALAQPETPQAYLPLVENPPTATPTDTPTATATVQPTPTTQGTATPTLPPPTFSTCGTPPANPASAPHYPLRIVEIDKANEVVWLKNTSTSSVHLDGWHMCSITGGQEHYLYGSIGPGETKPYLHNGGPIWNNNAPDPGALYHWNGSLVSYFNS